jgi:hypothetical protein
LTGFINRPRAVLRAFFSRLSRAFAQIPILFAEIDYSLAEPAILDP